MSSESTIIVGGGGEGGFQDHLFALKCLYIDQIQSTPKKSTNFKKYFHLTLIGDGWMGRKNKRAND